MQPTLNEQEEIIVRDSPEYKEYMEHRYGKHIERVKKLETNLAIWGRPLLIIYVVYTVVKASLIHALPLTDPVTKYTLLGVDALMLVLQVLGLEGGMPGLVHLKDEMETRGKKKEADMMQFSLRLVTAMLVATGIDIVLQSLTPTRFLLPLVGLPVDTGALIATYTNLLLIGRIAAVAYYLTSMARLSHKGAKIISQAEAKKQKEAEEQKAIRIDNANILATIDRKIEEFFNQSGTVNSAFTSTIRQIGESVEQRLESMQATQNERIAALSRSFEATQIASAGSGKIDSAMVTTLVESAMSRLSVELSQKLESRFTTLSHVISHPESNAASQLSNSYGAYNSASTGTYSPSSTSAKQPEKPQARITSIHEAREEKAGGLSVEEVVARMKSDPSLAELSDSQLAARVGTSKATANRAKKCM